MRILVTGRDGQVARAMRERSTDANRVEALGRPELDIADRASIERAIARFQPDVLVNAAAYTAVDKAESEPDVAFAVNRDGAGNAALAAAAAGLPVVHISTDYVFSGEKDGPYTEDDPTGPQSVYGHSKLAGEEAVAAANPAHVILRTAWVYSPFNSNFLKTMLRLAADRDVVRVVADQHGSPTYALDLADGILTVARRMHEESSGSKWRGVFHMTAAGQTSWAGFAEAIFSASAALGGPTARVDAITTAEYLTPAKRPVNSALSNARTAEVFDHRLPPWQAGVETALQSLFLK